MRKQEMNGKVTYNTKLVFKFCTKPLQIISVKGKKEIGVISGAERDMNGP